MMTMMTMMIHLDQISPDCSIMRRIPLDRISLDCSIMRRIPLDRISPDYYYYQASRVLAV